jgi:hypothetical protein
VNGKILVENMRGKRYLVSNPPSKLFVFQVLVTHYDDRTGIGGSACRRNLRIEPGFMARES